jgi:predicted MFS family arabinose efflux permease
MDSISDGLRIERERPAITRAMTLLMATACGLIIANIYYVQPLAGPIGAALGLPKSATGVIVSLTQIGYGLGLLLVVPLCDLLENRRLIVGMIGATAMALAVAGVAPTALPFLGAALAIGLSSTAVQMLVPFAASMAPEGRRGQHRRCLPLRQSSSTSGSRSTWSSASARSTGSLRSCAAG